MKATYQKPETLVVMLSTDTHLLEASNKNGIFVKDPDQTTIDLGSAMNGTDATSGNLSRRSIWDEEEEDF